jgi:hypothetical protein
VRHLVEADLQRADLEPVGGVVLAQVERVLDQVLVAPRADDAAERLARAAGRSSRGARARRPGQRSTGTGCWRGA